LTCRHRKRIVIASCLPEEQPRQEAALPEANDPISGKTHFRQTIYRQEAVVRRVSVLVLILFACFVSAAPGQQSAANSQNNWSEFLRTNMGRWNPYEHVLNVQNVKNLRR